jgi:hypothetical protein
MRQTTFILSLSLLALLLVVNQDDAGEGKKAVKPTQQWTAKVSDSTLRKFVPKNGYITNQDTFEVMWIGWRPKEKAPTIDFAKHLVLVHVASGPNIPGSSYTLDAEGNLRVKSVSTLIGGPGFGYTIDVIEKAGVKTYQGKPIE